MYTAELNSLIERWENIDASSKRCASELRELINNNIKEEMLQREAEESLFSSLPDTAIAEIFYERQADEYLSEAKENWYS